MDDNQNIENTPDDPMGTPVLPIFAPGDPEEAFFQTFEDVYRAQKAKVVQWQNANQNALEALLHSGVQLDPKALTDIRVAILTEMLFGDFESGVITRGTGHARLDFETRVQERIAALLADINSQLVAAKLTAGVRPVNGNRGGLIIPGSN